jgi:hypothetical protein
LIVRLSQNVKAMARQNGLDQSQNRRVINHQDRKGPGSAMVGWPNKSIPTVRNTASQPLG